MLAPICRLFDCEPKHGRQRLRLRLARLSVEDGETVAAAAAAAVAAAGLLAYTGVHSLDRYGRRFMAL